MSLTRRLVVAGGVGALALSSWLLFDRGPAPLVDLRQFSDPIEALTSIEGPILATSGEAPMRTDRTPKSLPETSPEVANVKGFFGRVVDDDGVPISGVRVTPPTRVTLVSEDKGVTVRSYWVHPPLSRQTDEEGRFRIDLQGWQDDEFILQFEHEDFVSRIPQTSVSVGVEATVVMLRLSSGAIDVQVFSTSGDPLSRFGVAVYTMTPPVTEFGSDPPTRRWPGARYTTLDGRLRIDRVGFVPGLPVQVELTEIIGVDYTDPTVRESLSRDVTLRAGAVTQVRMTVDDGAAERDPSRTIVRGVLVDDETGATLSGAYVHVGPAHIRVDERTTRSARRVQTRLNGTFEVAVPPDDKSGEVTFQHPGYDDRTMRYALDEQATYRLVRRGAISVRVVDDTGAPVAGCWVSIWFNRTDTEKQMTDGEGRVEFDSVKSGDVHLFALRSERASNDDALTNGSWSIAPGERREVTLEVSLDPRVTVRGRVYSQSTDSSMAPFFIALADGGGWTQSRLEPSGDYFAGGLDRGEHFVMILREQGASQPVAVLPPVMIEGVANQRLDFQLPSGRLRGTVTPLSGQGERIVAIPVDAWASHPTIARLLASEKLIASWGVAIDSSGEYELTHLAAGRYRLELRRGPVQLATREVEVPGMGLTTDVGVWNVEP